MSRRRVRAWALRRTGEVIAARGRERMHVGDRGFPASPGEISAEWLTAVLAAGTPGAQVTALTRLGSSVGTTTRQSIELAYNDAGVAAGLPSRLFVKFTATAAQRLMLGLGGLIDGEPGFYAHIRPQLEIEAPTGYFAAVDHRSWRSVVVMEDVVATRGASFWRPGTRITRDQVESLLAGAASWHGALWDSEELAAWRWLRTPAEQMGVIDALIGMADRRRAGASRAREVIPTGLWRRQRDLFEAMRRSMALASQGPPTYLHGDLHIANTYVTATGGMGVADWQVALKGSWAHDYAYLVTTACEIDDRRAWENELLELYLERLAGAGGPEVPRATAWEAYRRATFYPYFAWLYTIGRSHLQPRFQPDEVSLTMIGRISAAIEDLESLRAVGL